MNTESLGNRNEIMQELHKVLEYPTFKVAGIKQSVIRQFLENNKNLITAQKNDRELYDILGKFSNRVVKEFRKGRLLTPPLADDITALADQVFSSMNTASLNGRDTIIQELNKILEQKTFKDAGVREDQVAKFIKNNKKLIVAQKGDRELHALLGKLCDRVVREFHDELLADKIIPLADQVFSLPAEALPDEMWGWIMDEVPQKRSDFSDTVEWYGLKGAGRTSKRFRALEQEAKKRWTNEEAVPLIRFGCKSAKEAVDYVIAHQLLSANFSHYQEFGDLTDEDLEKLITHCPHLERLSLNALKITNKSAKLISNLNNLKELTIRSSEITYINLAECKKLQYVMCLGCPKLVNLVLPAHALELQIVNCDSCPLESFTLPAKAPVLQKIVCASTQLESLTLPNEAPLLRSVNCGHSKRLRRENIGNFEKYSTIIRRHLWTTEDPNELWTKNHDAIPPEL